MRLCTLVEQLEQFEGALTSEALNCMFAGIRFDDADLAPYVYWKPGDYTRNSVHRAQAYEIVLMAWDVGAQSPVHGHEQQTCWLMVHEGHLRIDAYAFADVAQQGQTGEEIALTLAQTAQLRPGDIEPDYPGLDIHSVCNDSVHKTRAISVHIYAKPFDSCITYDLTACRAQRRTLKYDFVGPALRG